MIITLRRVVFGNSTPHFYGVLPSSKRWLLSAFDVPQLVIFLAKYIVVENEEFLTKEVRVFTESGYMPCLAYDTLDMIVELYPPSILSTNHSDRSPTILTYWILQARSR